MKISIIGSGSKGNSTLIEINNKKILIDVGFSYKYIKEKLEEIKIDPKERVIIFKNGQTTDLLSRNYKKEVKQDASN